LRLPLARSEHQTSHGLDVCQERPERDGRHTSHRHLRWEPLAALRRIVFPRRRCSKIRSSPRRAARRLPGRRSLGPVSAPPERQISFAFIGIFVLALALGTCAGMLWGIAAMLLVFAGAALTISIVA